MDNISAIILAAGRGTRMKSELPKLLHKIGEKPMIFYAIEKLQRMGIGQIVVVVSPRDPRVKEAVEGQFLSKVAESNSAEAKASNESKASKVQNINKIATHSTESNSARATLRVNSARNDNPKNPRGTRSPREAGGTRDTRGTFSIDFAFQEEALGTGHAIATGLLKVQEEAGMVLCLNGDDSAFYTAETLEKFIKSHIQAQKPISMITLLINDQLRALGRVVRDEKDEFVKVLEHKDYILTDLLVSEINCGAYIFDKQWLSENYANVKPNVITGEYYVNELFDMAQEQKLGVNIFVLEDSSEWVGINTPEELEKANELLKNTQYV